MINELGKFSYFISKDGTPVQPQVKGPRREQLFIAVLESIAPEDAELLLQIKDREIKGVSKTVIQKAFPELGL
jgi:hypothetical protein